MTNEPDRTEGSPQSAPPVSIQPRNEHALRALRALMDGRLSDAAIHIDAITEDSRADHAWKNILAARLADLRGETAEASHRLIAASSILYAENAIFCECISHNSEAPSHPLNLSEPSSVPEYHFRLLAFTWDLLGTIFRRQDRPAEAFERHVAAFRLRESYGSPDEQYDSALNVGLDAILLRKYQIAQDWFSRANQIGAHAREPQRKQAQAWGHLTAVLTEIQDWSAAASAAEESHRHWLAHDPGSVQAAQAEFQLGHALLNAAANAIDGGESLGDAIDTLNSAEESLLAFGPPAAADVRICQNLKDFAEKLRAQTNLG